MPFEANGNTRAEVKPTRFILQQMFAKPPLRPLLKSYITLKKGHRPDGNCCKNITERAGEIGFEIRRKTHPLVVML